MILLIIYLIYLKQRIIKIGFVWRQLQIIKV
jgi:hypothetical protein